MNTLLKPLWLNFSCPILAYYFCAKLVLSFWDIFKDYIDENAFISFVQALFNVYVNTVYIAALIFIFYLASVCICWIKVAIEFVKARLKRAA